MEPEAEGRVVNCHNQAELGQGGSCIDKRQRARGIWSQGSGGAASLRKSRSGHGRVRGRLSLCNIPLLC